MANINQRAKMKENWKKMAESWKKWTPPAKPSKGEIGFFEQELRRLIKKNKKLRVLVLGATPEFRDLLAKYKINTTLVDINKDSIAAMTSLMTRKNPQEKALLSDWVSMSFPKDHFDLVLSDSAQDNIKFSEFKKFFEKIYLLLKPGGSWFFGAVNSEKIDQISFDEYINLYKKDLDSFNDFRNLLFNIFRLCNNSEFYNKKTRIFDFYKVERKVKKLISEGSLPKKALKKLTIGINYQMPVLRETEFKKLLSKKFTIVSEYHDNSHPAMRMKWDAVLKKPKS
jgi:hypothetical protein